MEAEPREESGITQAQKQGLVTHQTDQDRTLAAMHALEAALAAAAPGRENTWREKVQSTLAVLEEATRDEQANAGAPESLLADIARTQPRLRNRVRGVRVQYAHIRDTITSLRAELEDPQNAATDVLDLRQRLAWLLTALRHQRARESDLIYEAYYDAFRADLDDPNAFLS